MIRKIALAAIFVQVAVTAALATQIVLNDQVAGGGARAETLNFTAPVAVVDKRLRHTILVIRRD